jgi:hypothetical protein
LKQSDRDPARAASRRQATKQTRCSISCAVGRSGATRFAFEREQRWDERFDKLEARLDLAALRCWLRDGAEHVDAHARRIARQIVERAG